jgi:hypothetical protein
MSIVSRTAAAVAVAATTALAAGAAPAHAGIPCFKDFTGPGAAWEIQNDGSMEKSLSINGGSALDEGHGRLTVAGVTYPKLPNAEGPCVQTTTTMSFPARSLGGVTVSRSISSSGGRIRWLDTITNPGGFKNVSVDFAHEVLGSQIIAVSESGNDSADEDDTWTVHNSNNKLFPVLSWGQDGARTPVVIPEDLGPRWEDDFGTMSDDAILRYAIPMGAGETVRLLHTAAATTTQADGVATAQNTAAPFAGYSKAIA